MYPNLVACAWPYPPWLVSCIEPRASLDSRATLGMLWYSMVYYGMVVCYSVVWYCMVRYRMVWVLTIDGCSLQMRSTHL